MITQAVVADTSGSFQHHISTTEQFPVYSRHYFIPTFTPKKKEEKTEIPSNPKKTDLNLTHWHIPFSWEHFKAHSKNAFTFLFHSESIKSWAVMDEDVLLRLAEM